PVLLELAPSSDPGESLKLVKEQLHQVPRRGLGYGVLRYMGGGPGYSAARESWPEAQVSFNYHGQFEGTAQGSNGVALARESAGAMHSLVAMRTHLLNVNVQISDGSLHLVVGYSENLHERVTIEGLANGVVD